ncbi:MAG: helix-turn-helix domain-containing protein [Leptolinea sp.]|jgi:putative molybdopterin biosynthesis protein|nr:helix-turn-helix domain-containing protein [Leptolinea sp.]
MQTNIQLHSEEAFRILGDPQRVEIMRRLIQKPATISQLGQILGHHPAQIRYHISQLEKIGLVELVFVRKNKNYKEKYYQATTNSVFLNKAIFPWPSDKGQIVILGGDGPALNLLIDRTNESIGSHVFMTIPTGSLDSLIYLREGYCQIAGCHLLDLETGDFNISYIRHLFSIKNITVVTVAYRDLGLMYAEGNPHNISSVSDAVKKKLKFVNRKLGSGTRLRFDGILSDSRIESKEVIGYDLEAQTHNEVGEYIQKGMVDVGLGIASVARQMHLGFHYLFSERYDLVMSTETYQSDFVQILVENLKSKKTREEIKNLGGYDLSHGGQVLTF